MTVILIIVIAFVLILLFMAMPTIRRHPDRKLLEGLKIAHRGLHNAEIPENSIPAFLEAAARGYGIENDIHITSDGEIVVFHDHTLDRMCGVSGRVEDKTLAELKALSLNGTNEKIPSLKECLNAIDGRVPLLIEFKCDTVNCDRLCEAANDILKNYKGKYFVQSFNPAIPTWYKKHRRDILRGQLAMPCSEKNIVKQLASSFLLNFGARPDFVAFDERAYKKLCFKLQKLLGALPVGWTFRSQKDLTEKSKFFKAYIFEDFIPKD